MSIGIETLSELRRNENKQPTNHSAVTTRTKCKAHNTMDDNYYLLLEAFLNFPDANIFPADELFMHFTFEDGQGNEDGLIEDLQYVFTCGRIKHSYFPSILDAILNTWQEHYRQRRGFIKLPQKLWKELMELDSVINGITPPEKSIPQIENILEKDSKQSVCLGLLRQIISTNTLYNQYSYIQKTVLPHLNSRLERECRYIQDEKHPQIKMRTQQIKNATTLLGQSVDINALLSTARGNAKSRPSPSKWYEAFQKRYQEKTGKMLQISEEQRLAIETDDVHNTLVCSSAGSGKTTLLITRFFYLVECKEVNPEKILILAYTNAVQEEINDLIYSLWEKEGSFPKSWNKKKKVRPALTFHKLALGLIESIKGKPQIFDDVSEAYSTEPAGDQKKTLLLADIPNFIEGLGNIVSQYEVSCINMLEHVKTQLSTYAAPYKDFGGRYCCVRSRVEKNIFIYLAKHKVKFYYEKKFSENGWFPDFTLKDREGKICVYEHFTVNPYGNRGREWERYQNNAKEKIEYYTRALDGRFFYTCDNDPTEGDGDCLLKSLLSEHHIDYEVEEKKIQANEWNSFYENLKYLQLFFDVRKVILDELDEKINEKTKIKHISDELSLSDLTEEKLFWKNLFIPLNKRYSGLLGRKGTMYTDLTHCMIWAKKEVEGCKNLPKEYDFDYILIDEYQDISKSRFALLSSLNKKHEKNNKCKINMFAVGDDWQSIYSFTNSCLDLFSHFPEKTGDGYLIKNVQTYRFGDPLAKVSSKFVLDQLTEARDSDNKENRSLITKDIKKAPHDTTLYRIRYEYGGNATDDDRKEQLIIQIDETINVINRIPKEFFEGKENEKETIGILCRFRRDVSKVKELLKSKINDRKILNKIVVKTTHASKGLTFRYVFLFSVNNETDYPYIYQYENKLIQFIKFGDKQVTPHEEERRLFYVALTRAKSEVYLLYNKLYPSLYIKELEKKRYLRDI